MLPKHLRERDLAVRPQHLLIAFPAHLLVGLRVDIRVRSKDMIADVLFDGLLEKQLADAVTEHTEDGFERFTEDFRQEVSSVTSYLGALFDFLGKRKGRWNWFVKTNNPAPITL